ncbi:hypothetical protein DRZ77_02230 [Candidatus Woesearchaeota archaeon]|nr:MAG: hypothetical protein DRZ77_02230 [Candidatus Woesearchaeota archaeon]
MNELKIVDILKEKFRLDRYQTLILKSLVFNEKLTAKQLSNRTKIPLTKIYGSLKSLCGAGLIKVSNERPLKYYFGNFKERMISFLDKKFKEEVKNELFLVCGAHELSKRNISVYMREIKDGYNFVFNVKRMLIKDNSMDIITMNKVFPVIFYTKDEKVAEKIRNQETKKRKTLMGRGILFKEFYKSFWDAYLQNKKIRYIIDLNTWNIYKSYLKQLFTKNEIAKIILSIQDYLTKTNISIRITKSESPYCMFITETTLMFTIFNVYTSGLITENKHIVDVYGNLFNEIWKHSNPIGPSLEKLMYEIYQK